MDTFTAPTTYLAQFKIFYESIRTLGIILCYFDESNKLNGKFINIDLYKFWT